MISWFWDLVAAKELYDVIYHCSLIETIEYMYLEVLPLQPEVSQLTEPGSVDFPPQWRQILAFSTYELESSHNAFETKIWPNELL